MTEQQTTTPETDETPEAPQDARGDDQETTDPEAQDEPQGAQDETDGDEPKGRSNEAQKLRKRLRAVESERDDAQETIRGMRGVILSHALQGQNVTAQALEAAGHTADTLVGPDGTVDREVLSTAIASTAERFGIRNSNTPRPDPSQGSHGPMTLGNTWERAFSAAD